MKYRLGKGWDGDLATGEGAGGEKYADLSIYCGDEKILDLGIDHYNVICGGKLTEMCPLLMEMIRRLNEKEWENAISPRNMRALQDFLSRQRRK